MRLLSDDGRAKISKLAGELTNSTDINFSPLHLACFAKNDAYRTRAICTDADTEEKACANSMTIIEGDFLMSVWLISQGLTVRSWKLKCIIFLMNFSKNWDISLHNGVR